MGRTLPTFRMSLEETVARLAPYRRALSREDQAAFDELVGMARRHASASGMAAASNPFEVMLVSMLVEQEKRIKALERRP